MSSERDPKRPRPAPAKPVGEAGRPVVVPEGYGTPPTGGARGGRDVAGRSSEAEIADFLGRMAAHSPASVAGRGRLVFAMDATMSRQPTWDMALALQSDMFEAVKAVGGLDVQLVFFRGYDECRASRWVADPDALARLMAGVACQGGRTQIRKVLSHARGEAETRKVSALVFVGDSMEEDADDLCHRAGELALHGTPVFMFQEGREPRAEATYREIARLTGGAWCPFDAGSAAQLRALLAAVAVYAAGGHRALDALALEQRGGGARLLIAGMGQRPAPGGRPSGGR